MKNFFTVRNYLGTIIDRYYAEDNKETINMILNMLDTTYSEDTTSYQLFCNRETNDLYFHRRSQS